MRRDQKSANVQMRLSPAEKRCFEAVAHHHGLAVSAVIRMLVLREARKLDLEPMT